MRANTKKISSWTRLFTLLGPLLFMSACMRMRNPELALLRELPQPVVYKPGLPQSWRLENGLTVLYYQDEELPLIGGGVYMKGGSLWEAVDKKGSVSAMGTQMRQGGAGELSPAELDLELERLSASIQSSFGSETGGVTFSCLAGDLDKVFSMFSQVVLHPRFDRDRLDLWKGQALESIRRRLDDPETVAGLAFNELLFGDTPFGRVLLEDDVKKISRLDILQAHRQFVRPNGAIMALTGSLPREKVERLIREHFGSWEALQSPLPPPPTLDFRPNAGIYFINLPFSQATVAMGHQGVARLSPDHIAIKAFNEVFGGGAFGSRLIKKIRTDLGLVYGVWGAISPGLVVGQNVISLKTKAESTGEAIAQSTGVLLELQGQPVPLDELDEVKLAIQNSFVFENDSPSKVVKRKATLTLLDYPVDYDETFVEKILAVDPTDIRNVASKRWDVSKFVIVVVGDETAYNSLAALMRKPPEGLKDLQLFKVGFKEKLIF